MSQPLTADELQAIRARHAAYDTDGIDMRSDIGRLLATIDALQPNAHTKLVRVSVDLLPQLREWSEPVRFKITDEQDGVLTLLISRGVDAPKG